jgi:signal transduction histidine kinase
MNSSHFDRQGSGQSFPVFSDRTGGGAVDAPIGLGLPGNPDREPSAQHDGAILMDEPGDNPPRRAPLRFVWQTDAEHRFTVGSDEFAALMGPTTAAALGRPWPEFATALALDPQGQIALALASRETWSGLNIAWPVDGGCERLMVELSGLPVFDRERTFRGHRGFGICRDVARLATLMGARRPATSGAAAAEAAVATEAAVLAATPASENVVPLRPTGQPPLVPALSPVERNAFQELRRKLTERLTEAGPPAPSRTPDGLRSRLADAAQELPTQEAEQLALEIGAADPPSGLERTQAESRKLKSAKSSGHRSSGDKSDFLAGISHAIRTPLNAIIGLSEIMRQEKFGPLNQHYQQYLSDIRSSGEHLLALVNDLLVLSKIEAGKLDLDFTGVALNPLTQQCVAILQPQANRERIIIRTSLSPKLPPVLADARSLRQIVLNLIANSTKLTGAGGQVIVSTTLTDSGDVALRVRDSGTGLSEAEIALALEPFGQFAMVHPGPTGGSAAGGGFGLPLTKALAEANRATFSIKSAPNAGTLIEVAFPPNRVG